MLKVKYEPFDIKLLNEMKFVKGNIKCCFLERRFTYVVRGFPQ